jgi:hypothetical protein
MNAVAGRMSGAPSKWMFEIAGGLLFGTFGGILLWRGLIGGGSRTEKIEGEFLLRKLHLRTPKARAAATGILIVGIPLLVYIGHIIR